MIVWIGGLSLVIAGVAIGLLLALLGKPVESRISSWSWPKKYGMIFGLLFLAIVANILSNSAVPDNSPGHLIVCAQSIGGIPAHPAVVNLYSSDWKYIGSKTTDETGCTTVWENLAIGEFIIELYSPGNDSAYWGQGRTRVAAGTMSRAVVQRTMPYLRSASQSPIRVDRNQNIVIALEVANPGSNEWNVRAVVRVERDTEPPGYEEYSTQEIVLGNSSVPMTIEISELEPGTYSLSYMVETLLPWSRQWRVTDEPGWRLTLKVD